MKGILSEVDVLVVGGGSAGLCAAIAAARSGAEVLLLEKGNQLGGMGTRALVHTFCGLYQPDTNQPPRVVNEGLPAAIEREMRKRTGQSGPLKMGKSYVLLQNPAHFAALAREWTAAEEPRLRTHLGASCVALERLPGGGFEVLFQEEDQDYRVRAKTLVDTTASALGAKLLGVPYHTESSESRQLPAIVFAVSGVSCGGS